MKLTLAPLTALLVALAHAAAVPIDSTEISGNALLEDKVLNDAVENVDGNGAVSGLPKEVGGLVKQLTDALGGLLPLRKRDGTEITDNALIEAKVANKAAKNILNDAAKRGDNKISKTMP